MNYIIDDEMLECFKKSLRLNKKTAQFIIEDSEEGGFVPTKLEEKFIERQKEIIKYVDIVLEELEKVKEV